MDAMETSETNRIYQGVNDMLALRKSIELDEQRFNRVDRRMFWVAALRNRQLGLWAAHTMEMDLDRTEDYADEVVALGLQSGGELAIIDKLAADFAEAGLDVSTEAISFEMAQRTLSAEKQLSRPQRPDLPEAA